MKKLVLSLGFFLCLFSSFSFKKKDSTNGWFKTFCRVASSDAGGAWVGFKAGAELSGGNPYITGGATVILGAMASYGNSGFVVENPNPLSPDILNETLVDLGIGFGEKHNKMLNYLLSKKISPTDFKSASVYYQSQLDNKAILSDAIIASLSNKSFKYATNTDDSIKELYVYLQKNLNDTEVSTFIIELLNSVYLATSLSDALSIINAKEKLTSSFPLAKQQLILAGTNVLKASLKYWSNYSSVEPAAIFNSSDK
jgi:hypothetical protein